MMGGELCETQSSRKLYLLPLVANLQIQRFGDSQIYIILPVQ